MPLYFYIDNRYPSDTTQRFVFWTSNGDSETEFEMGGPAVEITNEDYRFLSQLFVLSESITELPDSYRYDTNLIKGDGTEGIIFYSHITNSYKFVRKGESVQMTVEDADALAARGYSFTANVAPTPAAPSNTVAPAVTGTPTVGQTLTCSTGTWTGYPAPTYTYQWYAGDSSFFPDPSEVFVEAISGETASTFTPSAIPAFSSGPTFCVVTATNSEGSADEASNTVTITSGGGGGSSLFDEIMDDGPIAYYRDASATDSSGNGVDIATYDPGGGGPANTDSLIATEPDGDGIAFHDGCNFWTQNGDDKSYFQVNHVSLSFWLKPSEIGTNARDLIVRAETYGATLETDGTIGAFANIGGFDQNVVGTTAIEVGETHHVGVTYDGVDLKLYVDGVLEGTNTVPTPGDLHFVDLNNTVLGALSDAAHGFDGTLDEVAFFDYALSATRIAAHYNAGIGA